MLPEPALTSVAATTTRVVVAPSRVSVASTVGRDAAVEGVTKPYTPTGAFAFRTAFEVKPAENLVGGSGDDDAAAITSAADNERMVIYDASLLRRTWCSEAMSSTS